MKLTTLELKGFKSFADKTTVHFNENITGVVGPNGSGKSNIVDAIRWVLGEQKAGILRSEKMDNLIFSGSRERKRSGLAEVSLSFENTRNVLPTEFKHVTITRRLFRSGESEYRLNDVPCRLKDITNLFLDTGISSDSYAIIELKMIDEILNDRDNSRRRLFEQAAGVSKYKKRKKETLNKLKLTDSDLERVQDLLFEIETNLKTLESQARKAKRYNTLKEDYKNLSLELAKFKVVAHIKEFDTLKAQETEQQDLQTGIESAIKKIEAQLEMKKADIIIQEQQLSEKQKALNAMLNSINQKENEKNISAEQLKFNKEKIDNLENQISSSVGQIKLLEKQKTVLEEKRTSQKQKVIEFEKDLNKLKTELEKAVTQRDNNQKLYNDIQTQTLESTNKLTELEKQLAITHNQKENLNKTVEQTLFENENRVKQLAQLKKDLIEVEELKTKRLNKLTELTKAEENLNNELETQSTYLENTNKQLAKDNRQLDFKENEFKLNKSLVDNLEGFPESIKYLKQETELFTDTPLLSDIIYSNVDYRVAIESYLEPFLNYFVVDDSSMAFKAIEQLNKSSKGRAHFFLLSEFAHYEPNAPIILEHSKPATEVVEVEGKYQKLAAYLLENVFFVDDNSFREGDIFEEKLPKREESITLLSKGGKVIRSNYTVSGGSVGLFEGMRLGRMKNLEKLEKDIEQLKEQREHTLKKINALESTIAKLKKSSQLHQINLTKNEVNQIDNRLVSIQTKIDNFQNFVDESVAKTGDIKAKIEELSIEYSETEKQISTLNIEKQKLEKKQEDAQLKHNEAAQQYTDSSSAYNEQNIFFHQQQNALNSIEQEIQFAQLQINDSKNRVEKGNEEAEVAQTNIKELNKALKSFEEQLLKLYSDKEAFDKLLSGDETEYYKAKGLISDIEEQVRNENKKKANVEIIQKEINDKLNELKLNLNSLKERLSVEFNIDINTILDEKPDEDFVEDDGIKKVERLKNRLENFGEINPMAVEAYDEMSKRHEFITTQKADLETAKTTLINTINEIEATAKDKFLEAFEKVRENFKKTFRELFTENDNCDLILSNPDEPLESNIEIIANPKGKKPQVIDQLSGGEKTLTALAILFSLYLLKPAPFCILDEVDAPLDDANIGKFNDAIKQFSKESQFILVTHNKTTMTAVDILYGVSQQEEGVSMLVPVDFSNLN